MPDSRPRLAVFSTLFPNSVQPAAGLFIRERMFRVAKHLPLVVVAPQPWFPFQGVIRLWRPHFRPPLPKKEIQQGIPVYHPKFISIPGLFKSWDGLLLGLSVYPFMKRLRREFEYDVIDAHFGYPDGFAATRLGDWLKLPVTITLRGTEVRHAQDARLRPLLSKALSAATRIFTVADSLRQLATELGIDKQKIAVMANGVDIEKFSPEDKFKSRAKLGLPEDAKVMITVGGLVERKGFHRVLEVMPALLRQFPNLYYLIVGGASAEGDWGGRLKSMVKEMKLGDRVRFLGVMPAQELKGPLSAADLFVLSTRNEGWANVLLEAMGCGVPVVATDVGGNREVVAKPEVGEVVPFDDPEALKQALISSLTKQWSAETIVQYARDNSWETRIGKLVNEFENLTSAHSINKQKPVTNE